MENKKYFDEEEHTQEALDALCRAFQLSRRYHDDLIRMEYKKGKHGFMYVNVILAVTYADGTKHEEVYRHINVDACSTASIIHSVVEKMR